MKLLFALQCANPGGTERVALGHMKRSMRLGHECRAVSLEPIGGLGPFLAEAGIPTTGLDFRASYGVPAYRGLKRLLEEYRPDALFQFGHRLVTCVAALTARLPHKTYYILHHHADMKSDLAWKLNYLLAANAYPHLLFLTEHTRNEALRLWPSMGPRTGILYAPIEMQPLTTPERRRAARAKLGLPDRAWLLGNAGRQVPIKRFDVFLRTAALVARADPNARFVLAGSGPEHANLRDLAHQLGLDERVIWFEWLADMDDFYRSLDAVCFSTDRDALGMVPLEALARGIPVVCSVLDGGLREVLPWTGRYLFDRHDPEQLAAAVMRLVGPEADAQVAAGRERIAELCDPDRLTGQLLASIGARAGPVG